MKNYKALKTAGKVSVAKDDDGIYTTIQKYYDPSTGEAQDDIVREVRLVSIGHDIQSVKDRIAKLETEQADLEQLETDLKAL
tara:strand:+ start:712 stop:957 length:246 start_codon:yes stop_codon:yes gene_type:complete